MSIQKASERGGANHGWLDAKHYFSFASYHNPEKVHFGLLRVLNDDKIAAGAGFQPHPHDNMEIVTIPLTGALQHKDNTGGAGVIGMMPLYNWSSGTGDRLASTCGRMGTSGASGSLPLSATKFSRGTGTSANTPMLE